MGFQLLIRINNFRAIRIIALFGIHPVVYT
jgi:hypothetical protein